jgi:two-component system chemotaxis response regulator CheB
MTINVCVVDDSALIRALMREIINSQTDMRVVSEAPNPLIAREEIKRTNPDVLTLDIEMPEMDGIDFLDRIMRLRPMPVIMVSTLTRRGSESTMKALELGAVDFIAKPSGLLRNNIDQFAASLVDKIRAAGSAKVLRRAKSQAISVAHGCALTTLNTPAVRGKLIVIGASTGGTEAIKTILMQLPENCPPILIVQHMPEGFTKSFAARLDSLCSMSVHEAVDGETALQGCAYIAPGNFHMRVAGTPGKYELRVNRTEHVNLHRPSVEVLFSSAAQCAGKNLTGVMLTGMGKDGAKGMLAMREAGSYNLVQDEASSVVFGMPSEVIKLGAANEVCSLDSIASRIIHRLTTS